MELLPGDWIFLVVSAGLVAVGAYRLYRENQVGESGIRPDLSAGRARVASGCMGIAALVSLAFAIWAATSGDVFVPRQGFFRGLQIHNWAFAPFAAALAVFCGFMVFRFVQHIRGTGPTTAVPGAFAASSAFNPGLEQARRSTPTRSARSLWDEAIQDEPDTAGLAQAVRAAVREAWGADAASASFDSMRRALTEAGDERAGELAVGLLGAIDAARYGGEHLDPIALEERFTALLDRAERAR